MPVTREQSQMEVLQKIRACITTNRDRLAYATRNAPVSTFAWLARNLLELAIWAEYCRSSPERSYQFLLDGARDAYDALDIPADLVLDSEHLKLRETLVERAATDGFDIEESYKKVITAAKELNRRDWFRHLNKTFSKFAHPTAFSIFTMGSDEEHLLREKFQRLGAFLATAGLMFTDLTKPVHDPFPNPPNV